MDKIAMCGFRLFEACAYFDYKTTGEIVTYFKAASMDPQSLVNITFGVILTGLGWFGRQLWDAVKELRTDLHKIEAELPRQYIAKDEFRHEIQELKQICTEIFRKIDDLRDKKADK